MPHTWMSHTTHVNESCHTGARPARIRLPSHSFGIFPSHPYGMNESCSAYESVTSRIYVCRDAFMIMYESRHTLCMSHVTPTNEICRRYWWVMSHQRTQHVMPTQWNMSRVDGRIMFTHEWGMSRLRNAICHTYRRVMFTYIWGMSHVRVR